MFSLASPGFKQMRSDTIAQKPSTTFLGRHSQTSESKGNLLDNLIGSYKKQIDQGSLPVGSLVENVSHLATHWKVSRPTMIQVLNQLVHDGYLKEGTRRGQYIVNKEASPSSLLEQNASVFIPTTPLGATESAIQTFKQKVNERILPPGRYIASLSEMTKLVGLSRPVVSEKVVPRLIEDGYLNEINRNEFVITSPLDVEKERIDRVERIKQAVNDGEVALNVPVASSTTIKALLLNSSKSVRFQTYKQLSLEGYLEYRNGKQYLVSPLADTGKQSLQNVFIGKNYLQWLQEEAKKRNMEMGEFLEAMIISYRTWCGQK